MAISLFQRSRGKNGTDKSGAKVFFVRSKAGTGATSQSNNSIPAKSSTPISQPGIDNHKINHNFMRNFD